MEIKQQIAELKAQNEEQFKLICELQDKLKAKPGPVVPWIGAKVTRKYSLNSYFVWREDSKNPDSALILDSPLHPQFMPNNGVNPWPDDMEVQVLHKKCFSTANKSKHYNWDTSAMNPILGSRPACGWEEYLKERDL
jgi:hypothetical protein